MRLSKIKLIFLTLLSAAILTVPIFVLAQSPELGLNYAGNLGLDDGGGEDIRTLIINIIRYALTFLGIVAVAIIMYGGFVWMTSNGQADRVEKAKKTLIAAVIGLIIILSAFAIVTFVANITSTVVEGGCSAGETKSCGCNGAGTKVCDASGVWGSCTGDCGTGERCCSWGCDSSCSTPPEFFTKKTIPQDGDTNVIRNVKVSYVFSRGILESSYTDAKFAVTDTDTGVPISGSRTVSGSRITFTPDAACGANPCGASNCFDSGKRVKVAVTEGAAGILSFGDIELSCPGSGLDCEMEFTVGDIIDCDNPKVNLDFNQICAVNNNELYAFASDNSGISQLEFFINGLSIIDASNPVFAGGAPTFNSRSASAPVWWDASAIIPGTPVNIRVTANDIDSRSGSDSKNFELRPGHCCNNTLDEILGEEGVDCGGPCAGCEGASCGTSLSEACGAGNENCDDTKCAGGLCACGGTTEAECTAAGYKAGISNCCICEDAPIIDYVTPIGGFCASSTNTYCGSDDTVCAALIPGDTCDVSTANASAGSLVTIGGRYFGAYVPGVSKVEFDGISAQLANTVNPSCTDSWNNNQIIVVLPNGLGANPVVMVTAGSGYYDTNADSRGETIEFITNTIVRPGLCQINPDNGIVNATITFEGVRLNSAQAFFGSYTAFMPALNSVFAAANTGTAQVPNVVAGKKTVFVRTDGVNSNYLNFKKNAEPKTGPYITSFTPASGSAGQYITITGGGFGSSQKQSKVYFDLDLSDNTSGNPADYGIEASYAFPDECRDNLWGDNQILIKVPAGMPIDDSDYYIVIDLVDADEPIDTADTFLTGLLPDPTFRYNNVLPLAPSLCRIDPVRGANNSEISLWGEYFGAYDASGASKVRFYNNKDQQGALSPAGPIISWNDTAKTNKISAVVHSEALTGPVKVVKNNTLEGNGLNFFIGECKNNQECDNGAVPGVCCPLDSAEANRCATDKNADGKIDTADCYGTFTSSVYEWEFTSAGFLSCDGDAATAVCDANNDLCSSLGSDWVCNTTSCVCEKENIIDATDSCQGRAQRTNSCNPLACPNSSGFCSPYSGGNTVNSGISCLNDICVMPGCTALTCSYSSLANKCQDNSIVCSRPEVDSLNKSVQAFCAAYNGSNRWHINTSASCPDGWVNIGNGKCIEDGTLCTPCPLGLSCQDTNGDKNGECVSNINICPSGTQCEAGACVDKDSAVCECCCRLPQGGVNYDSQDCCVGLTCAGDCGGDRITDTDQSGYCTGCRVESAGIVDVAASDAACNCTGAAGKFCDTEYEVNGVKVGACKDCSQLGTNASDCSDHATACCVDGKFSNNCRGFGTGNYFNLGGLNYCTYYDCTLPQKDSCDVIPKVSGDFSLLNDCVDSCKGNSTDGLGLSCQSEKIDEFGACNNGLCANPFQCLNESATSNFSDGCGVCCCDPDAVADECAEAGLDLKCVPDKDPCTTENRGLCCGCSNDSECVSSGIPSGVGCGQDSCCRARPNVESSLPADNSDQICRNAEINITFDQKMDIGSFNGNIILVGDYGFDTCPVGTEYLAAAGRLPTKKNFFEKIYLEVLLFAKKIINPFSVQDEALAYYAIEAGHNFCAVSGTASGINNASDKGVLSFRPSRLLDGNRRYYAIVKGDKVLNDDRSEGVKSLWEIGMNGGISESFNGITYANSHVFSFTTLSEQSANNGVCIVDSIDIEPESYLFQTTKNNQNDDDESNTIAFNTIKDSDKVFRAYARGNNQILSPISGIYDWSLVWTTSNSVIADFVPALPLPVTGEKQLIRTGTTKTEGQTLITALMQYAVGNTISGLVPAPFGTSDVYLFVCNNPWPPIESDGTWEPWQDQDNNCSIPGAGCDNYNYKLYYCRDAGSVGTYDDLPAIKSGYRATDPNRVIRGRSVFFSCSTTGETCSVFGSACGPDSSGICQSDYLKEVYFFREDIPTAQTDVSLLNLADGQTVSVSWERIAGIDGYKLYWGASAGEYEDYGEIYNDATDDKENISCTLAGTTYTCNVSALINDKRYYFNATSFLNTGTESAYFGEKEILVTDESAPGAPINFAAIPLDKQVKLTWSAVGGSAGYKLYYGVNSSIYGGANDVGGDTEVIISGLTNGTAYYFAVASYDQNGNESPRSLEVTATPASSQCGNGVCNAGECTSGCSADCDISDCCGIEGCNAGIGETTTTCVGDCSLIPPPPPPPVSCGNGTCDSGENASNCALDCGAGAVCGNGTCEAGECTSGCVSDCNVIKCCGLEGCNAGIGETSANCNSDCGGSIPPPPPPPPPPAG